MTFKPMLAAKLEDVGPLQYPVLVSPKIDGVRALIIDGVVMSRSLKPIPNRHVQKLFGRPELNGLDGELCVGPANAPNVMQVTMSGVMSPDGEPAVTFHIFDYVTGAFSFEERYGEARARFIVELERGALGLRMVTQHWVDDEDILGNYEAHYLERGFEGVMVRDPKGLYKQGRCGKKQPYLVKVKRYQDDEAEVIGVEELMHNDNEAFEDELGRTKRSTAKAGKRGAGVLGALICRTKEGVEFNIGTGFTAEQRQALYNNHNFPNPPYIRPVVGRTVKYKHFAASGVKDAPRFPVFLGFRDERDL